MIERENYILRGKDLVKIHGVSERTAHRMLNKVRKHFGEFYITAKKYAEYKKIDVFDVIRFLN